MCVGRSNVRVDCGDGFEHAYVLRMMVEKVQMAGEVKGCVLGGAMLGLYCRAGFEFAFVKDDGSEEQMAVDV